MISLVNYINESRNTMWMCVGGSTGKSYIVSAPNAQEAADLLKQFEEIVDVISIEDISKKKSNTIILIDSDTVKAKGRQISYEN